jgi:bifunctional non-homologous end joining protein LigD
VKYRREMRLRAVSPMVAVSATALPIGDEWSYEVKWDGYRALALKEGTDVRLMSRNLKDLTAQYPAIAAATGKLKPKTMILDGEIIAVDERGRSSFQALHHRTTSPLQLVFYVFDILHLNGSDLTKKPLDERREALAHIGLTSTPLLFSEPLPGAVSDIEAAVRHLRLEGVVAKRHDSRYEPGKRTDAWVKVKFSPRQEFVVGGFKPNDADFDSLLVGYFDDGRLRFAGKVRAGFTPHLRRTVFERIGPLRTRRCPFMNLPRGKTSHWGEGITADEMGTLQWVKPTQVVEVSFTEFTRDGHLRHAAFVGVRTDKSARDVRREPIAGE